MTKAIVRTELEKIPSVRRTWIEWDLTQESAMKTLVVEVDFDTDPNNSEFNESELDDIRAACLDVLKNKTTMIISHVRVVPTDKRRA